MTQLVATVCDVCGDRFESPVGHPSDQLCRMVVLPARGSEADMMRTPTHTAPIHDLDVCVACLTSKFGVTMPDHKYK